MRFRDSDSLLSLSVIHEGEDPDVFVVFENGMAKRSPASDWNAKGRGGLGVAVAKITERNGDLVGALTVDEDDEVLVIMGKGNIVRMPVAPVTRRGRNTQGMKFANPGPGDSVVALARNPERAADDVALAEVVGEVAGAAGGVAGEVVGQVSGAASGVVDGDSGALDAVTSSENEKVADGGTQVADEPDGDASGGTE
jgi:DNA gyrase subunit A